MVCLISLYFKLKILLYYKDNDVYIKLDKKNTFLAKWKSTLCFFLGFSRTLNKSHNLVNFQKKIMIFCMMPYFLPTYIVSIVTWGQKRLVP